MYEGAINTEFEGDLNRIDKLLQNFIGEKTFKHGSRSEIDSYFEQFENMHSGKCRFRSGGFHLPIPWNWLELAFFRVIHGVSLHKTC